MTLTTMVREANSIFTKYYKVDSKLGRSTSIEALYFYLTSPIQFMVVTGYHITALLWCY